MDTLPLNNIPILVSYINCLLRDNEYDNLEQICDNYNISVIEIEQKLESSNYKYIKELNTIKQL